MSEVTLSHLSLTNHIWRYEPPAVERIRHFQLTYNLPLLAAKSLATTNIEIPLEEWFNPTMQHLHDPFLMLGMDKAVERLQRAIQDEETILIVTDYDADGTMSCLVLSSMFNMLKYDRTKIHTHIPSRKEGYGFNPPCVDLAKEKGASLIITADIGVRDHVAVTLAKKKGIDVIICDHHLPPGESVPQDAYSVLCPPQDGCTYPNPALAACGVSFKLAQALLSKSSLTEASQQKILHAFLKVVAIGTVGDVVSLATKENRAIVHLGAQSIVNPTLQNRAGFQALLNVSGVTDQVSASDMGFKLAPRINAAGRMADPNLIYRLFSSTSTEQARKLAKELDDLNTQRKQVQQEMVESIIEKIPDEIPNFLVISGTREEGFHKGVGGIVAARLRDQFHRPVAVASGNHEFLTGSIRSIGDVHAVDALDRCQDILLKYGGHPVAAGFSLRREHLEEFTKRLNDFVAENTDPEQLIPVRMVQVKCSIDEISFQSVKEFMKMEPFGKDNYKPLIWLSNVQPRQVQTMGKENTHLRFKLGDHKAVWFGAGEHQTFLQRNAVDVLVEPDFNRYKGRTTVQLMVQDVRKAKL